MTLPLDALKLAAMSHYHGGGEGLDQLQHRFLALSKLELSTTNTFNPYLPYAPLLVSPGADPRLTGEWERNRPIVALARPVPLASNIGLTNSGVDGCKGGRSVVRIH